jgi:hypothetical protein
MEPSSCSSGILLQQQIGILQHMYGADECRFLLVVYIIKLAEVAVKED